jgi:hypothetical protein
MMVMLMIVVVVCRGDGGVGGDGDNVVEIVADLAVGVRVNMNVVS